MKDNEIIARIKDGEERSLDYLYHKHYNMMTRIVLRNSGTEDFFNQTVNLHSKNQWPQVMKKMHDSVFQQ